jgi:hypothetical protein
MKILQWCLVVSLFVVCFSPEVRGQSLGPNSYNLVWVNTNGHVEVLVNDSAIFDATALSGATVLAATGNANETPPGSGVTSYAYGNDLSIVYEGTNADIYQITFDTSTGWSILNLTALAGAPAVEAGSPLSNIFNLGENNQAYIYYFGTDLHIHELTKNTSGAWVTKDETVAAGSPNAAANSSMATLLFAGDFFVHYLTSAGHVEEIYVSANPSSGTWHARDLTSVSGAPTAFMGGGSYGVLPSSLANSGDQHEHVFFFTSNGHVHEIYSSGTGSFATDDATLQTGAPAALAVSNSSVTSFVLSNNVYVLYPIPATGVFTNTAILQGPENDTWTLTEGTASNSGGGFYYTSTYDSGTGFEENYWYNSTYGAFELLEFGGGCGSSGCDLGVPFFASLVGTQMSSVYWP